MHCLYIIECPCPAIENALKLQLTSHINLAAMLPFGAKALDNTECIRPSDYLLEFAVRHSIASTL